MKNLSIQHWHVFNFTWRRLFKTPIASVLNVLVIGVALSLPVGGYILLKNIQHFSDRLVSAPQITVFLDADTTAPEVESMLEKLKALETIDHVEFVPRDLALQQLQQSTGLADVVGSLTVNPLPDALVIYPSIVEVEKIETLRDDLKFWPKFEKIQLDSAWAYKLQAMLGFGQMAVIILATLLSFALVAITFNTIRLQILTQRDEIEVSKLIGATHQFIRRPFLYFGFLQGIMGGVTAWLIIILSLFLLNHNLGTLAQLYGSQFTLSYLSVGDSLTLLGFSAFLGWLGAGLSVSQHLWQIEPK